MKNPRKPNPSSSTSISIFVHLIVMKYGKNKTQKNEKDFICDLGVLEVFGQLRRNDGRKMKRNGGEGFLGLTGEEREFIYVHYNQ